MEFKTYINNITVVLEKNRIMLPLGEKNSLSAKMKKKSSMTTNKTENRNIKKNPTSLHGLVVHSFSQCTSTTQNDLINSTCALDESNTQFCITMNIL